MHTGEDPGCPLGRRKIHTGHLASVADARRPSGEGRQNLGAQIRRHIVPALKADGREGREGELKVGTADSTAPRVKYEKSTGTKQTSERTLADGSKATGESPETTGAEGTKQSEQSSGWAQASPACSQSAVTSSQWQCSTANTPTVANISRARQAKSLERAKTTAFRFRAVWPKSSEARPSRRAMARGVTDGHSSWSYPDQPTRSLVAFLVASYGRKLTNTLGMSQLMKENRGSPLLRTSCVKVAERMGFEVRLCFCMSLTFNDRAFLRTVCGQVNCQLC
jgi:hypothetical protein